MDKLVETRKERFWYPEAWARDQWVKAESAKLPTGTRVLDAGAGASKYRPFFAHCRYETQDFCRYEGPLVRCAEPIDYVCEITKIPLPDGCLGAILCTEVLEHVIDPMAVLSEFGRLLKPEGKLLLTTPMFSGLHMEPYHYYSGFTLHWYRHWLPKRGFVIDNIVPQGGRGRTGVYFLQQAYGNWRAWELEVGGVKRILSLGLRMLVKLPVHYMLPMLAVRWGTDPNPEHNTTGLMVAATRRVHEK
ncbi:MAG TPA: class I SAM-dependent methyltransferase [Candidatus Paceibacterota bacterium]|nr:class I SAM-dependent methyltransferase [Verrucomicrobiota bacterium]HSA09782.1 class I SAM-dependent methyltransferase [Candidatus Paceibacterota bacterium]